MGTKMTEAQRNWAAKGADREWCSDNTGPDDDMIQKYWNQHKDKYTSYLSEAKDGLSRVNGILHESNLNDDAVLEDLVINAAMTVGNSLVSIADSLKRIADCRELG